MTPTWMDAERKLALAGIVALFSSRLIGIVLLLGGLLNLRDNAFAHHGEQHHFMPPPLRHLAIALRAGRRQRLPRLRLLAVALVFERPRPNFVKPVTYAIGPVVSNTCPESRFACLCEITCPTRLQGGTRVLARYYALALLAAALTLAGCSGNYKFNDDEYRPLGDPQAVNRGY